MGEGHNLSSEAPGHVTHSQALCTQHGSHSQRSRPRTLHLHLLVMADPPAQSSRSRCGACDKVHREIRYAYSGAGCVLVFLFCRP